MNLVVRAPNWVGDAILSIPALNCLHQNFPQEKIWVVALPWVKDIFSSFSFIQNTISLPSNSSFKNILRFSRELKKYKFQKGLLFTNSFSSALLFYLAKIPQRWGYSRDGRSFLLTKGVRYKESSPAIHQVYYYLDLISKLGLKTSPPFKLHLPLTKFQKEEARKRLVSLDVNFKKPVVIIHPGAYYGPAKRWPVSHYARLVEYLQKKNQANIIIVGSSEERPLSDSIASSSTLPPVQLCGKTSLSQLAGLISVAHLVVTNDSGPMHMASALRTPVVSLFGPTNPLITGPFQQPFTVIKKDTPCTPCSYRECPSDHRCMNKITPEEVWEACQKYM